ncbi:hypothetical protein EV1_002412 [Malus domestica]
MGFNRNRVLGKEHQLRFIKDLCTLVGEVAIKRFERADGIGSLHHPFTTEFATMVGCLRQKNLIQLHGWCCERNELVLVYEYIAQRKPQQMPLRKGTASCARHQKIQVPKAALKIAPMKEKQR